MKCDIYLKLWSYAQNCLICTLHPFYCENKLSIRYGAHKPVRVSCSHCHVVDVMNDIILCSYAGFVLYVCLLNRCGKCTYMAINTFWIWIWIWIGKLQILKSILTEEKDLNILQREWELAAMRLTNERAPSDLSRTSRGLEQIARGAICFWTLNVIYSNKYFIYQHCGIWLISNIPTRIL